jgi:adenylosuccinate synthase
LLLELIRYRSTGRPRRCGWLDIPVIRFAVMVGGLASLNLTKLDVLGGLRTLRIGTHYVIDGERLECGHMPSTCYELSKVKMEYEGSTLGPFLHQL